MPGARLSTPEERVDPDAAPALLALVAIGVVEPVQEEGLAITLANLLASLNFTGLAATSRRFGAIPLLARRAEQALLCPEAKRLRGRQGGQGIRPVDTRESLGTVRNPGRAVGRVEFARHPAVGGAQAAAQLNSGAASDLLQQRVAG